MEQTRQRGRECQDMKQGKESISPVWGISVRTDGALKQFGAIDAISFIPHNDKNIIAHNNSYGIIHFV